MRHLLAATILCASFTAHAAELNIYDDSAWVKESRSLNVHKGTQSLTLENLPRMVDANSVMLLPEGDALKIRAQQYRFDLQNNDALLAQFLDQEITVERITGNTVLRDKGVLLQTAPLTLHKSDGSILSLQHYDAISLPKLPEGIAAKPALYTQIDAASDGTVPAYLFYQTRGLRWWADYILQLDKTGTQASLSSHISVENQSGKSFHNATLAAIEGTTQKNPNAAPKAYRARSMGVGIAAMADAGGGVIPEDAGDLKRYTISQSVSLPDNSTTRLPFLPEIKNLAVKKSYRYEATPSYGGGTYTDPKFGITPRQEVAVLLSFRNDAAALPAGKIRVFETSPGNRVFLGEPALQRTSQNENVTVPLGTAFDITAKRVQESFESDNRREEMEESIRITLQNHSAKDVVVDVVEHLYRGQNAELVEKSHPFERIDSQTVKFPIAVAAGKDAVLKYKARYTW